MKVTNTTTVSQLICKFSYLVGYEFLLPILETVW
jgi:hypothetical protein